MRFVSSNTNYVEVNDGQGIIQTAFTNFVYNWFSNGLGGVTVQGNVNGISMRQIKTVMCTIIMELMVLPFRPPFPLY